MGKFHYMTELDVKIIAVIRRYVWVRWGARVEALKRASYYVVEGGRRRRFWRCEECGVLRLTEKERDVDHINPVVDPEVGFVNLSEWVLRCFVEADGLQVLCRPCHKAKTALEAQVGWKRKRGKTKKSKNRGKK
jgi:5-methylcytosine-specific restriction endonuclease McrA